MTSDGKCPRCGEVHARCTAHARAGKPCTRHPMTGQTVCAMHGGKSPQAVAAAQTRVARAKATAFLASVDIGPDEYEDPMVGLLEEVTRSSRAVAFWGMVVRDLDITDLNAEQPFREQVAGMNADGEPYYVRNITGIMGLNHDRELSVHTAIKAWNEERERHAKLCKLALDAGIAERMVLRAERDAQVMVTVIMAVITSPALALSGSQQDTARQVAATELRKLDAQSTTAALHEATA